MENIRFFKIFVFTVFLVAVVFLYLLVNDKINFGEYSVFGDKIKNETTIASDDLRETSGDAANASFPGAENKIYRKADENNLAAKKVLFDMPFASQAPFGEWSDPRQQDGCEEASALMAVKWGRGEALTKEQARQEIIAASEYQKNAFGHHHDTSAKDTIERIFKGYFNYEAVKLKQIDKVEDIVSELYAGNIVIVPASGQILKNPNYTAPGPERHMLLIRGYDPISEEFITNDPGTRKGEGYRYSESVVFGAIRDYLTGHELPIDGVEKVMIIVGQAN